MPNSELTEPLALSPDDAARALSLGRTKLFAMIRSGQLKAVKVGSRTLVPIAAIKALLNEGRQDAA